MTVRVDSDFIVSGAGRNRLSPNFTYGEFQSASGNDSPRIHLDLVSGLQTLRGRFGRSIKIRGSNAAGAPIAAVEGLFIWISGLPMADLEREAKTVREEGVLSTVLRVDNRLFVAVAPSAMPSVEPESALDVSVRVTAAFETSGDPYQQVTGNFDGAGLSFGPAQVNFGTGTLPPVFAQMRATDETALRECFGSDWQEWLDVLAATRAKQVAWADNLSRGAKKAGFAQPWKGHLQAVGRVPLFRNILVESAKIKYGSNLRRALGQLNELAPDIVVDRLRCVAALYDLCTQQGSLDKALDSIRNRVVAEGPEDQRTLVRIAVIERGAVAKRQFRADCISRRLTVLDRVPTRVAHSGEVSTRKNRNLWLVRGVKVKGLESL